MKRNTVDLIKDMNNPNQYIESFGLPFKYNPNDTHYINPMVNPLCFLDFIQNIEYKINISHMVSLKCLVDNKNVLMEVPKNSYASEFMCAYSLYLLLTKDGYVAIHSHNKSNVLYHIKRIYNELPKEMQVKDLDDILDRVIMKNNKIANIKSEDILLHVYDYFNFNIFTHISKDCQLLIINEPDMMKPYRKYVKDNFKMIKRKFTCVTFSYKELFGRDY